MPSGGITITPGYQLGVGEPVNNSKLNQGFQPIGQVNEGAITDRELSTTVNNQLGQVPGVNQFCNGDFSIWMVEETGTDPGVTPLTGVITGGRKTDRSGVAHWFVANDVSRNFSRQEFPIGQTEVPNHPRYFARWVQYPTPIDPSIPVGYFGQRLENVRQFSGATVTFSIWVRGGGPLTITPQARQFFGTGGSADVVIPGPAQAILANTWTEIKTTFQIPSVSGKAISDLYVWPSNWSSFTEFRIVMSHTGAFQIDFAHAMLSYGDFIPGWDARPPNADYLFASRYEQRGAIYLSNSLTNFAPFVNLRVPMLAKKPGVDANVVLTIFTGTGATIGAPATGYLSALIQATPNSVVSNGSYFVDSEPHAPN